MSGEISELIHSDSWVEGAHAHLLKRLSDSHEDEQEERLRILAELIGGKETGAIIQLLFSATAGPTSR